MILAGRVVVVKGPALFSTSPFEQHEQRARIKAHWERLGRGDGNEWFLQH